MGGAGVAVPGAWARAPPCVAAMRVRAPTAPSSARAGQAGPSPPPEAHPGLLGLLGPARPRRLPADSSPDCRPRPQGPCPGPPAPVAYFPQSHPASFPELGGAWVQGAPPRAGRPGGCASVLRAHSWACLRGGLACRPARQAGGQARQSWRRRGGGAPTAPPPAAALPASPSAPQNWLYVGAGRQAGRRGIPARPRPAPAPMMRAEPPFWGSPRPGTATAT